MRLPLLFHLRTQLRAPLLLKQPYSPLTQKSRLRLIPLL
jgi:hypothetical protein